MKEFKISVIADDEISFRDIQRVLNVLDAESELIDIKECEDDR